MPRRATATSFGGKHGNDPRSGPKDRGGAKPSTFLKRMRLIAERKQTLDGIEEVLADTSHKHYAKVLDTVLDRGIGPVPKEVKQAGQVTLRIIRDEK